MDICFSRVDSADAGKGDQENGPAGPLECGRLLGICDIVLLERAEDVPEALSRLRGSMRDPVIAVDLEWRPDILGAQDFPGIRQNRVALIQLATSSLCVLIRTCSMGFHLPRALQDFFR